MIKKIILVFQKCCYLDKIFQVVDRKNSFLTQPKNKKFYICLQPKREWLFFGNTISWPNFNAKRVKLYRPKYFVDVHKSEVFIVMKRL